MNTLVTKTPTSAVCVHVQSFLAHRSSYFLEGGYTNPSGNRTVFPLEGGFFKISTGHPDWTGKRPHLLAATKNPLLTHSCLIGGVMISTEQNATSFDDFKDGGDDQWIRNLASSPEAGDICVPFNLTNSGIDGIEDGANVTIQIVLTGSDGNLYQVRWL